MSGIVLTASVRANLLSLQSTADLLATTQNRLATGKKVNSALDNPTNFFTAQGLDNRAQDIANLLDGVGNGVQVIQAANTGITALQKLVDAAKSVGNQVLQAQIGYSTKSNVTSTANAGVTADDLTKGVDTVIAGTTAVLNNLGTPAPITAATGLVTVATSDTLAATPTGVLTVNGKTITFDNTTTTASATDASGNVTIGTKATSTATVQTLLSAIDSITGTTVASTVDAAGKLQVHTGTATDLVISGTATSLTAFGLTAGTTSNGSLAGKTLTIGATGSGTATSLTFGTGAGQIKSLNDLNTALAANNLQATVGTNGAINIVTTNDAASETIGTIGGTAFGAGKAFTSQAGTPVKDPTAQLARSNLIDQFNDIVNQLDKTAQDASFGGINLLNGDDLTLTFNETGSSKLTVKGGKFDAAGLGLGNLIKGTDFLDNHSAQVTLQKLNVASSTLRSEGSKLGSNLSVVQIRQDFSKNLINVLQTGSSNLTLADTNEEAANSQALNVRQQIATSAQAQAFQAQQAVLSLLR